MSENVQLQAAKDDLASKQAAGLIFDKLILPGQKGYEYLPGDTRPLDEQEPLLRFRKPEKVKDVTKYRLTDLGQAALLEYLGISKQQISAREQMHGVFFEGYDEGYEHGQQAAGEEAKKLKAKVSELETKITSLESEMADLKQQLARLSGEQPSAEPEPTDDPEPEPTPDDEAEPAEAAPAEPTPPADTEPEADPAEPADTEPAATAEAEPADTDLTTAPEADADAPADAEPTPPADTEPEADPAPNDNDPPRQGRFRRALAWPTVALGNFMTRRTTVNYEYDEQGRVSRETRESEGRGRMIGALVLAAVAGGIIAWELKTTGHSSSHEARQPFQDQLAQLKLQESKDFTAIMKGQTHLATEIAAGKAKEAADYTSEMNAIAANKAQILARVNEVHNSDLKAIQGVLRQVHQTNVLEHKEFLGHGGGDIHHQGLHGAGKAIDASLSYKGDTVWHEVSRHYKKHLAKVTGYVLKINHLKFNGGGPGVDAHDLPVGFHFKIPVKLPANIAQMFKR